MNSGPDPSGHKDDPLQAYVLGELTGSDRQAFEARLQSDILLREQVEDLQALATGLKDLRAPAPNRDLKHSILQALADEQTASQDHRAEEQAIEISPAPGPNWARLFRYAALLALLLGGLVYTLTRKPNPPDLAKQVPPASIESRQRWLASAQAANGSWDPKRWGGQEIYRTGVTGLALLALLNHPDSDQWAGQIKAGTDYLLSQFQPTGSLQGSPYNMAYNLGATALALLEIQQEGIVARERLTPALQQALARARTELNRAGNAWGYQPHSGADTAAGEELWLLQLLARAHEHGYTNPAAGPRLQAALQKPYLGRSRQPVTESPVQGPDLFYEYLQARARSKDLAAHTAHDRPLTGAATDRWLPSGGRVYSTSMAILIQAEKES